MGGLAERELRIFDADGEMLDDMSARMMEVEDEVAIAESVVVDVVAADGIKLVVFSSADASGACVCPTWTSSRDGGGVDPVGS